MALKLFDSLTQSLRDFEPREAGRVGLYVCGPTVQSSPHVGHLRSALVYDLWRRWFAHSGYEVTLVRNVTDIDDKILINAEATRGTDHEEPWWALAYRYELEFTACYQALRILPPTYEPRATASIDRMQQIISRLLERGHAYVAGDGSGDVYFDTASWPEYGALTRQSLTDMAPAADAPDRAKKDPHDFALWKGSKPDEPASAAWDSPWGQGRPGWHIECSAMSSRYLGAEFDIHGGGLDLRFPHHENEIAQSRAAGDPFARNWLHNGLVNVDGQKMSKSLGNSIFAHDFLDRAPAIVVRYYFASAHYRSTIDYHDGALEEAAAALGRITSFLQRSGRALGEGAHDDPAAGAPTPAFVEAMDDDLGTPQAFAAIHDAVRQGNSALDADDLTALAQHRGAVLAMTTILGINPLDEAWQQGPTSHEQALSALVERLLEQRARARADKSYAEADRLREALAAAGIAIEDTADGTVWSLDG